MYFRIYKALNLLLWMIPCRKKYWRDGGRHGFSTPFCRHVRVVERLFLFDFDKHSSLFIQLLHTYVINIVYMNKFMFLFSIITEKNYNNKCF